MVLQRYSNVIKQNWVQKNVLKLDFERRRDRACESEAGGLRWSGVRAPWRCEVRGCQGLRTAEVSGLLPDIESRLTLCYPECDEKLIDCCWKFVASTVLRVGSYNAN